jgi:hypothetical protein
MTIEEKVSHIVALAERATAHAREGSTQWADETIDELRAAILALLDEEAEACHAIVSEEDLRWDAMDRIRARIAERRGEA